MIKVSDFEFRELWFVPAVFAVGKEFRLIGLELSKHLIGVDTGFEMLEELLAFLILQQPNNSIVVSTLHQHSLIWDACQLVIDLYCFRYNVLCSRKTRT